MKFFFIVTAMILNIASSNNPNSININLETAFEFEPKNNKQHLRMIDDIQQFLTKLRTALNPETGGNEALRSKNGFNICNYLKDILNGIGKYDNKYIEAFFQAVRSDVKTRYNRDDFRAIFNEKSVRGYIKKTFADLNRTSTNDKRAMLQMGEIAMNAEPEYLMRLNEFFGENDKKKIEKYIEEINNHSTKRKDFHELVKKIMDFLIFDRYAKLNHNDKIKVNQFINGFGKSSNKFILRTNDNVHRKQRDFVLNNNLEIAVKALAQKSNNQFNIQIQPVLNTKTQATEVPEFKARKVTNPRKKTKTKRTTSIITESYKNVDIFKHNSNLHTQEVKDESKEREIKKITPKNNVIDEIIDQDIKNLLENNVNDNSDKTKAVISTKKPKNTKNKEKTSETEYKNRLKLIDAPVLNTDEESQERTTKTSYKKHKKNKQEFTTKTTKNDNDKSDSEIEKTIENKEALLRANENTFSENNNDIIEPKTDGPKFVFRAQSAEFAAKKNKEDSVSKPDENNSETKVPANNQENNSKTIKDENKKDDTKDDDNNSNLENELKNEENSEEIRNREAFEKAELSFKILENKFNRIKNKGDDLAVVKPPPKEAFMKIRRDLGI